MPSSTTKDVTVTVKDDDTKEKDTGADLKPESNRPPIDQLLCALRGDTFECSVASDICLLC